MRRVSAVVAACAVAAIVARAQQNPLADLKTTAESSGFKSTSTYEDVVKFMKVVDEASPIVFYTTYGTTTEGRALPLAVVGTGLKDASPAAVKATGKLRVHIQANVHAGEVEGKESAQILLRELAAAPARRLAAIDGLPHLADLQRRRQREVRAQQPATAERPDQRHGHARQRAEPEHQPRLHEARYARGEGVRQVDERLRSARQLRPAHLRRLVSRLLPDLLAAAQSRHVGRDHEDHDRRVVPGRDEGHEGEARLGLVLLRQRVDAGRPRLRRCAAIACGFGGPGPSAGGSGAARTGAAAAGAAAPAPAAASAVAAAARDRPAATCRRRKASRASGARSSTCRASTTTTSACATVSRC